VSIQPLISNGRWWLRNASNIRLPRNWLFSCNCPNNSLPRKWRFSAQWVQLSQYCWRVLAKILITVLTFTNFNSLWYAVFFNYFAISSTYSFPINIIWPCLYFSQVQYRSIVSHFSSVFFNFYAIFYECHVIRFIVSFSWNKYKCIFVLLKATTWKSMCYVLLLLHIFGSCNYTSTVTRK
jgi:hypothetical protein